MSQDMFKQAIENYVNKRAEEDSMFAEKLNNPNKSIDECINFILNEVKESGRSGFEDDEIYGLAVHYYDEEDLGSIEAIEGEFKIIGNWKPTEEEIETARKNALKRIEDEEYRKLSRKSSITSNPSKENSTPKQRKQSSSNDNTLSMF